MVLRSTVIDRASGSDGSAPLWGWDSVQYSMDVIKDGAWRQDCSGWVSACWEIPPGDWGGPNTVALVTEGFMYEIDVDDLKPGDAVGVCGPGTEGANGHVQIFLGWQNDNPSDSTYTCSEQTPAYGPQRNVHDLSLNGYRAYRYRDIQEEEAPPPDTSRRYVTVVPYTDNDPDWRSTLWGIAAHYGTTVESLVQINGVKDPALVYPDQTIYIDPE